jgi:2-polyprenyl-6-hydroxyphenyl methylase / 3-demethylubiquinone-9 3-methyltransferase
MARGIAMSVTTDRVNADAAEVAKFSALAHRWWDATSEFKPLHDINPLRIEYIKQFSGGLTGQRVCDVGCGGGLVAEVLSTCGANALGIDLSDKALGVAKLHALETGASVQYRSISAEDLAAELPGQFDGVSCLEMLEHVPDPASIVNAVGTLLKPGGWAVFSTLNRNAKSYAMAVLGAEYILRLLPRGTHEYSKFIKPSELCGFIRAAGLEVVEIKGMAYNPLTGIASLNADPSVNYLIAARKPR